MEQEIINNNQSQMKKNEKEEDIKINLIEFCPEDIQSSTFKRYFVSAFKYSDLITELNRVLALNNDLCVKNIETFMFIPNLNIGKIDANLRSNISEAKECFYIDNCRKLFGIRVWFNKYDCTNSRENSQQIIQVYNYIPKKLITGYSHATFFVQNEYQRIAPLNNLQSTLQELQFENLNEVLAQINDDLIKNINYGNIINIETVKIPLKVNEYSVNVDSVVWPQKIRGFVLILRVFVSKSILDNSNPSHRIQVEMHDFIPKMETWDSPLAIPDFESFTSVLKRTSAYLRDRKDNFKIVNCSTISSPAPELNSTKIYEYKEEAFIDSKQTYYSNKSIDYLIKFLRVFIIKPLENTSNSFISSPTTLQRYDYHLNCKIFVPFLRCGNITELQNIFNEWFKNRDLILISVETETVSSPHVWTSSTSLVDTSLTIATATPNANRKMFFKFYVNGSIKDSGTP